MIKLVDMMAGNGIRWENMVPDERDAFDIMATLGSKDDPLDATDVI